MDSSTVSNTLTVAIEKYIQQHDATHTVCSINDILKIISEWDGAFNEKNIETSLAYASTNGHTETTAFLVALNAELFGRGVDDCSLML